MPARPDAPLAFAVDGNSYVCMHWHGTRGDQSSADQLARLVRYMHERRKAVPTVYFDDEGPTWRHKIYPEYKAGRPEKPDALRKAIDEARERCDAEGWYCPNFAGYEADDMLAVFAKRYTAAGSRVIILSNDKDARQLLRGGSTVLIKRATRSFNLTVNDGWQFEFYNAAQLLADHGLTPEQWPDFRALTGDTSDNWPGCYGIGDKTAQAMLQNHRDLPGILATLAADPLKLLCTSKQRETLAAFDWQLGRRLMTLLDEEPKL